MANFDDNISLDLQTDAPPVSQAGFGTMLVVGEATFAERIKFYSSPEEVSADDDLTDMMEDQLNAAFAQTNRPAQVAAGRRDSAEPVKDALDAIRDENPDFYGIVIESRDQSDAEDAGEWALTNKRVFMGQNSDEALAQVFKDESNDRAAAIVYSDDEEPADAAWMADRLAIDPDVQSATWAYVQLSGIPVDSVTTTEKNAALDANGNLFLPFYGLNVTNPGVLGDGTKLDVRITLDWLLARVSENIAQELVNASVGGKIPYTDGGFKIIEAAVQRVLDAGVDADHFVEGSDFIDMPKRADVDPTLAQSRELQFEFGVGLAGAVEDVTVSGTVTFDLDALEAMQE